MIGLVPLWDEEKDSLWMLPGYMDGVIQAGGLPVMLPLTTDEGMVEQLTGMCAGFLFTGGHDVFPGLYGAKPSPLCGPVCEARDTMERALFSIAVLKQDKPAFGICRGIQFFNALLGGTLHQDLSAGLPGSGLTHRQRPPYDRSAHRVGIEPGSPLYGLLEADSLAVNSCHHQGIAELSPELVPMARAEDGLVEAVYMKGRSFVWAVQWHPEMALKEESSRKIFGVFVNACR